MLSGKGTARRGGLCPYEEKNANLEIGVPGLFLPRSVAAALRKSGVKPLLHKDATLNGGTTKEPASRWGRDKFRPGGPTRAPLQILVAQIPVSLLSLIRPRFRLHRF